VEAMHKKQNTRDTHVKTDLETHFTFSIGDTIGVSADSRRLHWHDELEICHVKQGTGKYLINGNEYWFEPGDVFIINNDEIHLAYDDNDLIMRVVLFSPSILWAGGPNLLDYEYLAPFTETGVRFNNKLSHAHPHIGKIIKILDEIQNEYDLKQPKYELMIKTLLMQLMTYIIRYFDDDEKSHTSEKTRLRDAQRFKDIAGYIRSNYTDNIKLDELAETFKMSVSTLCRLFRRFSGASPIEYIIFLRLNAAKDMLLSTDKKILDIACDCGFTSISSFNKAFRRYTGVSLREYRNR